MIVGDVPNVGNGIISKQTDWMRPFTVLLANARWYGLIFNRLNIEK